MDDRQRRTRWVEIFSSLASEPRLHIVELLSEDAVQCQEILGQLELSQPAVSYHLAKLERPASFRRSARGHETAIGSARSCAR